MIPLATTTVTVESSSTPEPYETTTYATTATAAPAHISGPSGSERAGSDGVERVDAILLTDATVERGDRVTDDATGTAYRCTWATRRTGLGLDHTRAGLVHATGGVPG